MIARLTWCRETCTSPFGSSTLNVSRWTISAFDPPPGNCHLTTGHSSIFPSSINFCFRSAASFPAFVVKSWRSSCLMISPSLSIPPYRAGSQNPMTRPMDPFTKYSLTFLSIMTCESMHSSISPGAMKFARTFSRCAGSSRVPPSLAPNLMRFPVNWLIRERFDRSTSSRLGNLRDSETRGKSRWQTTLTVPSARSRHHI